MLSGAERRPGIGAVVCHTGQSSAPPFFFSAEWPVPPHRLRLDRPRCVESLSLLPSLLFSCFSAYFPPPLDVSVAETLLSGFVQDFFA